MASDRDIEIRVSATDDASDKLDDIADRVDDLGDGETEVVVDADVAAAESAIDRFERELDALTSDRAREVRIEFRAQQLQRQIRTATRDLERLEDPVDIDVRQGELEEAIRDLDELRDLTDRKYTVDVDADGAESALSGLGDAAGQLPGPLGEAAGTLGSIGGPGGLAAAAAGGLFLAAQAAADAALDAQALANLVGGTVEDASRLASVWQSVGDNELNDLQDIILNMNSVLAESPELARQLGVDLADGRSGGQRFVEVVEALSRELDDAGERGRVAGQLFGEEGVRQVNTLTTIIGTDLQAAVDGVAESEIFSSAEADAAAEFKRQMADLQIIVQGIVTDLGTDVIPLLSEAAGILAGIADVDAATDGGFIGIVKDAALNAIDPLSQAGEILGGLQDELGRTGPAKQWGTTVDGAAAAAEAGIDGITSALARSGDAGTHYGELMGRVADDIETKSLEASVGVSTIGREWDTLTGKLSDRSALLDIYDAFADVEAAAIAAYDAAATGAVDAEQKARDHERAQIALKEQVIEYTQALGSIPPEVVSDIVAQIDDGSIATAEAVLAELARNRTATVRVNLTGDARDYIPGAGEISQPIGNIPGQTGRSVSQSAGNVTINMPRAANWRDVTAAAARQRRINGR